MKIKIPIEILEFEEGYHILVEAKINNKKLKMVLDTGASKTVFDFNTINKFIKKVDYKLNDFLSVGIGTNTLESYIFEIPKLSFGRMKLDNFETVLIDMSMISESYSKFGLPEVNGILGSDIMVENNAILDIKNKILLLDSN